MEVVEYQEGTAGSSGSGSGVSSNTLTNEVVVDALPYIDLGYDEPGVREAVSNPELIYSEQF